MRLDRDWYTFEEGDGAMGDGEHDPFGGGYTGYEEKLKEEELAAKKIKRVSARQAAYNADADAWENDRLFTSGIGPGITRNLDFSADETDENRVHLLVHDVKPPFLDGKTIFSKQTEPVVSVRDATSDLAIFAKKGSALVKERRERREREKQSRKALEVGGTALGNLIGVKEELDEDTTGGAGADGESRSICYDYQLTAQCVVLCLINACLDLNSGDKGKEAEDDEQAHNKESKFASHLKASQASSAFSRSKTLKQQRQFLPAFACREALMKEIRENQGTSGIRTRHKVVQRKSSSINLSPQS